MNIIDNIKQIAEVITSLATALIIIMALIKKIPKLKYFLIRVKINICTFFTGTLIPTGQRVRFFKGIKEKRNQNEAILKAIAPDYKMEDLLVLDKSALLDIISNSKAFYTIQQRKP